MAVSYYQQHRPRTTTVSVSVTPDFSGDWVAVGADMQVEINAALIFVNALGGGKVVLLQGTFTIDDPITFPGNNLTLSGMGRATFIDGDALATTEHGIVISGRTDCVIRNLSIQTQDGGTKTCHCIFIEDGSDRFLIENVTVVDSDTDGIHVEGTTINTGRILSCVVLGSDDTGIFVDMDAANFIYRLHVLDCDIGNCGVQGIYFATSGGNMYCQVINNIIYLCTGDGILLVDGDYSQIRGNICTNNGGDGIEVESSRNVQVLGNLCYQNVEHGILLDDGDYCLVEANHCLENDSGDTATYDGINVDVDSRRNDVLGNVCVSNRRYGIHVQGGGNIVNSNISSENDRHGIIITASECEVNNNLCYHNGFDANNTYDGINFQAGADRCMVNGNTCFSDGARQRNGIILIDGAINCTVNGNICYSNASSGITLSANNNDCVILGNHCLSNGTYGININADTCNRNLVKNNILSLNVTAPFQDNGTDTKLATKVFQFIQGTTFISAAGNPWGWEIDVDAEFAIALGQLPLEVQQVVRIKIWAVGLVSPGVADAYMRAQFTGEAAASDEVYTTNPIDVVDKNCVENNPAANAVIHWMLDPTDDADIGNLLGGDSIQFKVLHEGGAGNDIETDAIFRCIEIEYV